jgi:NDP-mannose synthase
MNGDLLTDLDFGALVEGHRASKAACTMAVYQKDVKIDLGVLGLSSDDVAGYLPRGQRFDLPDLVRALIAAGERVRAHRWGGTWLDMGTPDDYALATERFQQERERFLPGGLKPKER